LGNLVEVVSGQEVEIIANSTDVITIAPTTEIELVPNELDVIPAMSGDSYARYQGLVTGIAELDSRLSGVDAEVISSIASIVTKSNVTADNLASSAYLGTVLNAEFNTVNAHATALVTEEAATRATAISAEAQARTDLGTTINGNISTISNKLDTTTTLTEATATAVDTLTTSVNDNVASIKQTFAAYSTTTEADAKIDQKIDATFSNGSIAATSWFDSKMQVHSDAISSNATNISTINSAMTNPLTGLTATAKRADTLYTGVGINPDGTVNANAGAIHDLQVSVDGIDAKLHTSEGISAGYFKEWDGVSTTTIGMVHTTADGTVYQFFDGGWQEGYLKGWKRLDKSASDTAEIAKGWAGGASKFVTDTTTGAITGWSFASGSGVTSSMLFNADKFTFASSNGARKPFSIYTSGSYSAIVMDANVRVSGTLTFGAIEGAIDGAATTANWSSGLSGKPTDSALLNSAVSMGSNGVLYGAGGGRVTTSGIGAETPSGAQSRANIAESSANSATDTKFSNSYIDPTNKTIAGWKLSAAALYTGSIPVTSGYSANTDITLTNVGTIHAKEFFIGKLGGAHFKGKLDAPSGNIGGWTIGTNSIYSGVEYTGNAYNNNIGLTLNKNGSIHAKQFYIDSSGSAFFKGSIAAGNIDTLSINNEAVTVAKSASGGYSCSIAYTPTVSHIVALRGEWVQGTGRSGLTVRLKVDGTQLRAELPIAGTLASMSSYYYVTAGVPYTFTIAADDATGDMRCYLFMIGVKR